MDKQVVIVTVAEGITSEDIRAALVQGLPGVLNVKIHDYPANGVLLSFSDDGNGEWV